MRGRLNFRPIQKNDDEGGDKDEANAQRIKTVDIYLMESEIFAIDGGGDCGYGISPRAARGG